jgi:hypothetical protein
MDVVLAIELWLIVNWIMALAIAKNAYSYTTQFAQRLLQHEAATFANPYARLI